jgi:hypothetical protein
MAFGIADLAQPILKAPTPLSELIAPGVQTHCGEMLQVLPVANQDPSFQVGVCNGPGQIPKRGNDIAAKIRAALLEPQWQLLQTVPAIRETSAVLVKIRAVIRLAAIRGCAVRSWNASVRLL